MNDIWIGTIFKLIMTKMYKGKKPDKPFTVYSKLSDLVGKLPDNIDADDYAELFETLLEIATISVGALYNIEIRNDKNDKSD